MLKTAGSGRRQEQCSFCGRGREEVRRLVAGPSVFICDRCVELCTEILATDGAPPCEPPGRPARVPGRRAQGHSLPAGEPG